MNKNYSTVTDSLSRSTRSWVCPTYPLFMLLLTSIFFKAVLSVLSPSRRKSSSTPSCWLSCTRAEIRTHSWRSRQNRLSVEMRCCGCTSLWKKRWTSSVTSAPPPSPLRSLRRWTTPGCRCSAPARGDGIISQPFSILNTNISVRIYGEHESRS